MTKAMNLLAFDLGAESGRSILGQFDGHKIKLSEISRFINQPIPLPDGLHWDILNLWTEIRRGIGLAVKETGGSLSGIGIDTWGVDFGLLDRNGALLGNPYHYRDGRTDGMMEAVFQKIPKEQIYAQTGIQFLQLNTLFQLYSMVLSKSPQLAVAETFLTIPDLLNYWLTGRKVCEFSNATTTQCFDTVRRVWAAPLLDQLGIPTAIFPDIVSPGTILGNLRSAVSEETGGQSLPVIAPACHDTGSAVAAVPAVGKDFAWISSGTWSIMGYESPDAVVNNQALAGGLTNEGGVNGTYRLSKNIMGLWPVQESRRTWARQGTQYSYDDLTRMAGEAEGLRSIIDPDHNDFLKPGDMPARIQEYCQRTGQPIPETPGQVVRCALEGVALKYRWTLEQIENLLGKRLDPIHIVGGGTQNKLLSQFAADATGRTVVTGPIEATATGNLLVQAVALGEIQSIEQAREIVRRSFEVHYFEPDPSSQAAWQDAYAKLLTLM